MATYHVSYPSGKRYLAEGEFKIVDLGPLRCPLVDQEGAAWVLDQRAIVTQEGKVIYHPRRNVDGLTKDMKDWLGRNPNW